jgi:zinc transport system substrate-binding protein
MKTVLLLLIVLSFTMPGCTVKQKSGKPVIFVSILPQKFLAERIAGGKAEIHSMTQPGQDPHTFEPAPSQMFALSDAVLYITAGIEFENIWIGKIREANPSMKFISSIEDIVLIPFESADAHEHGHSHDAPDPHVWLSPVNAMTMAKNILHALELCDSTNKGYFRSNYDQLIIDLTELDRLIRAQLQKAAVTNMLVFHPSWGYFAKEYGLKQIAIEYEGKEPSPQQVGMIIDFAKKYRIDTLFVQPQFNEASAKLIAEEAGCRIVIADPLAENYIENLKSVAGALAQPK